MDAGGRTGLCANWMGSAEGLTEPQEVRRSGAFGLGLPRTVCHASAHDSSVSLVRPIPTFQPHRAH